MTWYKVTDDAGGTHRGTVHRGQLITDCHGVFLASKAERLEPDSPPRPQQICADCEPGDPAEAARISR